VVLTRAVEMLELTLAAAVAVERTLIPEIMVAMAVQELWCSVMKRSQFMSKQM
jgi:hypothetical protein